LGGLKEDRPQKSGKKGDGGTIAIERTYHGKINVSMLLTRIKVVVTYFWGGGHGPSMPHPNPRNLVSGYVASAVREIFVLKILRFFN
jgi:hypothetical protein